MSLVTYRIANKLKVSGRARQPSRTKAGNVPTIAGRLRGMLAAAGRRCASIFEAIAEARAQKAMIEAELYLNRYKHASKNDDDLPVVR